MDCFCSSGRALQKRSNALSILILIQTTTSSLFSSSPQENGGRQAFGNGVLDSILSKDEQQIDVHGDWEHANWSIGYVPQIKTLPTKPNDNNRPPSDLIHLSTLERGYSNSLLKEPLPDDCENKISSVLKSLRKSISIHGNYVFDYSYNASGGISTGSSNRSFSSVSLIADLHSMLSWKNSTATIEFQKYEGDDAFDLVGDFQNTGNNDGDDVEILAELWIECFFMEETLRLKLGKIDSNNEFAFVDNGIEFLNASISFASPTIFTLTTSPETAVGANLFMYPHENVYGGFGIYDGATQSGRSTGRSGLDSIFRSPGKLFFIGEVGGSWINQESKLPSCLGIGVWRHNANFDRFDGDIETGAEGFYIVFDKSIWEKDADSSEHRQSLDTFLQFGYTSGSISEVEKHLAMGLVMSTPLGTRAEDVSGVGFTWVDFTDDPAAGFDDSFELAIEYFYKFQYNAYLSVKADLQYVVNPGGDSDLNDAVVPGLRLEASF